jgi:RNA polymerase sigma-70 factor (ECF subfamily)
MESDDELLPTRASLLSRLKDWNDGDSWQDFFDTYWKLIYLTARKAGLDHADAEEIVQETFLSVSKAIREFHYDRDRGSFKAWLRNATVWRISDYLRRRAKNEILVSGLELSACDEKAIEDCPSSDDLSSDWDAGWEDGLEHLAVLRIKKRAAAKQFQVFDLAVIRQWTPERIAKTLHVSRAYIYLAKHRISRQIRSEIEKLRANPLSIVR